MPGQSLTYAREGGGGVPRSSRAREGGGSSWSAQAPRLPGTCIPPSVAVPRTYTRARVREGQRLHTIQVGIGGTQPVRLSTVSSPGCPQPVCRWWVVVLFTIVARLDRVRVCFVLGASGCYRVPRPARPLGRDGRAFRTRYTASWPELADAVRTRPDAGRASSSWTVVKYPLDSRIGA